VFLKPVYDDIEDRVTWNTLSSVSVGIGNIVTATLQKMLDNVSSLRAITRQQFRINLVGARLFPA